MASRVLRNKQLLSFVVVLCVGFLLWFSPHPLEISDNGWHFFAIFTATILAIVLKPMALGAIAIVALTLITTLHIVPFEEIFSGFKNHIVWLVVFAFFISKGIVKTGLGIRLAYYFISLFGKRTLGLSYSLLFSDLLLAPAIPSVTARAGGIIFPIVTSLSQSFGSDPEKGTERRIGSFLMKTAYQGSTITSAMFVTAMAANPLIVGLTQQIGYSLSWGTWALAALLPGILSLICMPLIVYKLYPPEITTTPHAHTLAQAKLKSMGSLTIQEWIMLGIFVLLIFFWIFGEKIGLNATVVAMLGISTLLLLQVLEWEDVVRDHHAWDTFLWFATLITMASLLQQFGLTAWLSGSVSTLVGHMSWQAAFALIVPIYFYAHYFFASNTAHVGALYISFLMVAIAIGVPATYAILVLAFSSNLMGGLTHYGSSPAPLYYGSGYIDMKSWWRVGFLLSLVNLAIWIGLGSLWWKFLDLW